MSWRVAEEPGLLWGVVWGERGWVLRGGRRDTLLPTCPAPGPFHPLQEVIATLGDAAGEGEPAAAEGKKSAKKDKKKRKAEAAEEEVPAAAAPAAAEGEKKKKKKKKAEA